jgi:hypothetical protein
VAHTIAINTSLPSFMPNQTASSSKQKFEDCFDESDLSDYPEELDLLANQTASSSKRKFEDCFDESDLSDYPEELDLLPVRMALSLKDDGLKRC